MADNNGKRRGVVALGSWLAIGIGIGAALGAATGSMGTSLALGVSVGLIIGLLSMRLGSSRSGSQDEEPPETGEPDEE